MAAQRYEWSVKTVDRDYLSASECAAVRDYVRQHPDGTLYHDPDWLYARASRDRFSATAYVCHGEDGTIAGFAPFVQYPSGLTLSFMGRTLYSYAVRRHALTEQILLSVPGEQGISVTRDLLRALASDLEARDIGFVLGLPTNSDFARTVMASRESFMPLLYGRPYQRRLAGVKESLDEYLAELGSKTRQNLRRQQRKLAKVLDAELELRVFRESHEVEEFLSTAEAISQLTYQWQLLNLGVRNDSYNQQLLQTAARQGWMRCYVLSAAGKPLAFMLGYTYGKTYYSDSIGYDPEYARFSPGNVLHLAVMDDLSSEPIEWFDFLHGENENKRHLSIALREEQNVCLLPKTLRWRVALPLIRALESTSAGISALLEKLGVKEKLRRVMRKRAQSGA